MLSQMSVHTSMVLMLESIHWISSSLPSLWSYLDIQSAMNNCDPGLYRIHIYICGCEAVSSTSSLAGQLCPWRLLPVAVICYHTDLVDEAVLVDFFQSLQYYHVSFSILLHLVYALVKILQANVIGCCAAFSDISFLDTCIPSLTCRRPVTNMTPDASLSRYSHSIYINSFMHVLFLMRLYLLMQHFGLVCPTSTLLFLTSVFLNSSHTFRVLVSISPGTSLCLTRTEALFFICRWHISNCAHFMMVWLHFISGYNLTKEGDPHTPEVEFTLLYLRFSHGMSTLLISVFCCDICCWYHTLQLEYHLQY